MSIKSATFRLAGWLVLAVALSACGGGGDGGTGTSPLPSFIVGGTVSGLVGSGLVLQNSGGNDLAVAANGSFAFSNREPTSSTYSVTVKSQPVNPAQTCSVSGATGVIGSADVDNVAVSCTTQIVPGNAQTVASAGNALLELLPQFAEFVGGRLTFLSAHLAAQVSESCADPNLGSPGAIDYVYTDVDRDGSLSASDTVVLTLANCFIRPFGDYVSATLALTVDAPAPSTAYRASFAATANVSDFPALGMRLNGQLGIAYKDSDEQRVLEGYVGVASLSLSSDGIYIAADTITLVNAGVTKILDYVAASYAVQGSAVYRSAKLQGEFSMSGVKPLAGGFGKYPNAGVLEYRGGTAVLRYEAQDIADNTAAEVRFNDGSGVFKRLSPVDWGGDFRGFSWQESRWGTSFYGRPTAQTGTRDAWFMGMIAADPLVDPANYVVSNSFAVNTPIKLFFTAELDVTRTTFVYEPTSYVGGATDIPAVVAVNGAFVTVTAQQQLQHGVEYLLKSVDGAVYTPGQDFGPTFNRLTLRTANNLRADGAASPAVAAPGQTVALKSSRSFSADSTIVAASWRQVSGTPAQLTGSDSRTASFTVPASATNGEALVFELAVTDANGEADRVPVTAFAFTDLSQPFLYYRRAQGARFGTVPERATLASALLGPVVTEFRFQNEFDFIVNPNSSAPFYMLQLVNSPQLDLATYPVGPARILVWDEQLSCNEPQGQFVVREIQRGPANEVVKFAADFEEDCPGGAAPLIGSVRVNSLVPLP